MERGIPHTGPKTVTIAGEEIHLSADDIELLKSIYNEMGPRRGVGVALNKVLVDTERIPNTPKAKNLAWYPVAKIVGHQVPSQRSTELPQTSTETAKSVIDQAVENKELETKETDEMLDEVFLNLPRSIKNRLILSYRLEYDSDFKRLAEAIKEFERKYEIAVECILNDLYKVP